MTQPFPPWPCASSAQVEQMKQDLLSACDAADPTAPTLTNVRSQGLKIVDPNGRLVYNLDGLNKREQIRNHLDKMFERTSILLVP